MAAGAAVGDGEPGREAVLLFWDVYVFVTSVGAGGGTGEAAETVCAVLGARGGGGRGGEWGCGEGGGRGERPGAVEGRGAKGGDGDWDSHLGACYELLGAVGVGWRVRGTCCLALAGYACEVQWQYGSLVSYESRSWRTRHWDEEERKVVGRFAGTRRDRSDPRAQMSLEADKGESWMQGKSLSNALKRKMGRASDNSVQSCPCNVKSVVSTGPAAAGLRFPSQITTIALGA